MKGCVSGRAVLQFKFVRLPHQSKVVPYVWDDSFNTKRLAAASSVSDSSVGGEKNTKSTGDNDSSRPSRDAFDKTVGKILNDINSFFVRKADYTIYDANELFENRMNGRVARNVLEFKTEMNYLRIWATYDTLSSE